MFRLRQRYLRWLAVQPDRGCCLSPRRRRICRALRQQVLPFVKPLISRRVLVVVLAAPGTVVGFGFLTLLVLSFFLAPEGSPFADPQHRATTGLARLAVAQTFALILSLLASTYQVAPRKKAHRGELIRTRELVPVWKPWVVALLFTLGTLAVSVTAVVGLPHGTLAAAGAIVLSMAIGLLTLSGTTRLLAVRLPGLLSSQITQPVLSLFLFPLLVACWIPGVALLIGHYLEYLGPFGWLNQRLVAVGEGDLWQLILLSAAVIGIGACAWLNGRATRTFALRRRLLKLYRVESLIKADDRTRSTPYPLILGDLRAEISGRGKVLRFYRSVARNPLTSVVVIGLLLVQGLFIGLARWLTQLADFHDTAVPEAAHALMLAAAQFAGLGIIVSELLFVASGVPSCSMKFAHRPVSIANLWTDFQLVGLQRLPLQLLIAFPTLIVTPLMASGYLGYGLISVGLALSTCVAVRTAIVAGACSLSSACALRNAIQTLLSLVCIMPLQISVLLLAFGGSAIVPRYPLSRTLTFHATLHIVAIVALLVSWILWHVVSRPRRILIACW